MSPIVAATDFSEGGNNAVFYAASLAEKAGCTLILVHAYKAQTSAVTMFKGLNEVLEQDAKTALLGLQSGLMESYPKLEIFLQPAFGEAGDVVNHIAKQQQARLVVAGTRGKSVLDVLFFGSTSRQLSKSSKVPLLLVPPQAKPQAGGVLSYATALRTSLEGPSVALLLQFKQWLAAELEVVHVYDSKHPLLPVQNDRLQELQRQLAARVGKEGMIDNDDVLEALLQYVQKIEPAVLAIHLQHWGFIEQLFVPSVSGALMKKIKIPLLLLPHEFEKAS
jgi:nucleotide-binding universal stress UspA family protein